MTLRARRRGAARLWARKAAMLEWLAEHAKTADPWEVTAKRQALRELDERLDELNEPHPDVARYPRVRLQGRRDWE